MPEPTPSAQNSNLADPRDSDTSPLLATVNREDSAEGEVRSARVRNMATEATRDEDGQSNSSGNSGRSLRRVSGTLVNAFLHQRIRTQDHAATELVSQTQMPRQPISEHDETLNLPGSGARSNATIDARHTHDTVNISAPAAFRLVANVIQESNTATLIGSATDSVLEGEQDDGDSAILPADRDAQHNGLDFDREDDITGVELFEDVEITWEDVVSMPYLQSAIASLPSGIVVEDDQTASFKFLVHLPWKRFVITAAAEDKCVICQESYQVDDAVRRLPCKHIFHANCIFPWIPLNLTCPICRDVIFKAELGERLQKERNKYLENIDWMREMQQRAQDYFLTELEAQGRRQRILNGMAYLMDIDEEDEG